MANSFSERQKQGHNNLFFVLMIVILQNQWPEADEWKDT